MPHITRLSFHTIEKIPNTKQLFSYPELASQQPFFRASIHGNATEQQCYPLSAKAIQPVSLQNFF